MTSLNLCSNPDLVITSMLVSRTDKAILQNNHINVSRLTRSLISRHLKERGMK